MARSWGVGIVATCSLTLLLPCHPAIPHRRDPWILTQTVGESADTEPTQTPSQARMGGFRVGNRTPHPVRLVILLRSGNKAANPEPAHWDFAPGEGGSEGLLLSLGEDPLQIAPGDVVVAFTIDGTKRYWGPNVVGESLAPFWDSTNQVWSMILQP